ncbi:MAG: S8 family serine peptidase [Lachnospiraceae bacterium]|nr:S8 family serine peptidase [Lachnospiraceae bacterium]
MKTKIYKVIAILLAVLIVVSNAVGEIKVHAKNKDKSRISEVYTGEDYRATYTLLSSWKGGSNFQITLQNTGNQVIENWSLLVEYDDEIDKIWNAKIQEHEDGQYIIHNDGWNQDIDVDESITFGMSSLCSFTKTPSSITLLENSQVECAEGITVECVIVKQKKKSCKGKIIITNTSDTNIEDWSISFDSEIEGITFWNGTLISHEDSHYVVHNAGYNAIIAPGKTVSVGFEIQGTVSHGFISNLAVIENKAQNNGNYQSDNEIDEDRLTEPLEDIGENYFKEAFVEDVGIDDETGIKYVKNQLLISAYMGTPKEAVEELVEELEAGIVGYTEVTCDYQVEFNENKSISELEELAEFIEGYPYVSGVSLNTVSEVSLNETTNDYLYNDNYICEEKTYDGKNDGIFNSDEGDFIYVTRFKPGKSTVVDDWNEETPYGDNWGLEALHVPSAWDLVSDSHPVKVGIIDNYFENVTTQTGKKELVFDDILRNVNASPSDHGLAHGDHVAGIIGATQNNGYGISGVATNVKIYGYTMYTQGLSSTGGTRVNSMAGIKVGLSALICNHVKVINMSLGYSDSARIYGASHGAETAIYEIQSEADVITKHLKKMINAGYDFLIVKSAGNENNDLFIPDNSEYNYHEYKKGEDNENDLVSGGALAQYSHYINAIDDYELKSRIIVVGSFGIDDFGDKKISKFSNIGSRVDVIAPGEKILSTAPMSLDLSLAPKTPSPIPGFKIMSGTSMAAPYISGIAALMYQVKPNISAKNVKRIICSSLCASGSIDGKNIPDARKCVEKALSVLDSPALDADWPMGLAAATIRNMSMQPIVNSDIKVQATRHNSGDYNLDNNSFCFEAEADGTFLYPLPQGTYDILIYIEKSQTKYLPTVIRDIEILPNETTYIDNIRMSAWTAQTSGTVKGIINNAFTGSPLSGVTAKLRKGWNVKSGPYVTNLVGKNARQGITASDGTFIIAAPIGAYTVELEKDGYVTAYYNVLSTPDNAFLYGYDATISMTPILPDDEYRIILTWGSIPSDLDSHLLYYRDGSHVFHVYYGNKNAYIDGVRVANLDLDDTSYYGPETVTVTVDSSLIENGELRYCVHNFSGGSAYLSESNASVAIYKGNEFIKALSVTQNQQALVWHVFTIDKKGIHVTYSFDNTIY